MPIRLEAGTHLEQGVATVTLSNSGAEQSSHSDTHHSWSRFCGYSAGLSVFASTFGDLFCTSSESSSPMSSACFLLRCSFVSLLVEKLFIRMKRTCAKIHAIRSWPLTS